MYLLYIYIYMYLLYGFEGSCILNGRRAVNFRIRTGFLS